MPFLISAAKMDICRTGRTRQIYRGFYIELKGRWKSGDTVALTLPKKLSLEPLPDDARIAAIIWGPLVLAGDLGPERTGGGRSGQPAGAPIQIPSFVAAERPLEEWVKSVTEKPGNV